MLTKDLLNFKTRSTQIVPGFVDIADESLLLFAQQLLNVFSAGIGNTREEIDSDAELYLQGQTELKLAKGLYKLLMDHAEFSLSEENASGRRHDILTASALLLKHGSTDWHKSPPSIEEYRSSVASAAATDLTTALYPDLPAFEKLSKIKTFNATQLLQRYNMAQVQALLLTAQSLTLTTEEMDAANLRRIFKCLKFFRLLAEIKQSKSKDVIETTIVIDGPLSVLDGAKKYGLQIASFFPVICLLQQWNISARIKPKRSVKTLKLDQTSALVSHYQHMSAFVPEEVRLFAKHFEDTVDDWQFVSESPFLKRPRGRIIFPDFTLRHTSGVEVYLEIFHRWHRGPLNQRLEELTKIKVPLILAIDRSLLKGDWQESIEALPLSQHFLFSDYPAVSRLQKSLDACLKAHQ